MERHRSEFDRFVSEMGKHQHSSPSARDCAAALVSFCAAVVAFVKRSGGSYQDGLPERSAVHRMAKQLVMSFKRFRSDGGSVRFPEVIALLANETDSGSLQHRLATALEHICSENKISLKTKALGPKRSASGSHEAVDAPSN